MHQDERRERQRKRVKQRYYQTLHGLSYSRKIMLQLTDRHQRLIQQLHTVASSGHALRRYTEATALVDEQWQEKQRLMGLIAERDMLQDRLLTLVSESNLDHVSGSLFTVLSSIG